MKRNIIYCTFLVLSLVSCKKYLDIVPDNIPTLDNAFTMRSTAERYLYTCYSYLPSHGDYEGNPAFGSGDETWLYANITTNSQKIANGNQKIVDPYLNYWDGSNGGSNLFIGIRDCNTFLENIPSVPDMEQPEKDRWISEVKFLKAYYHYWLLRMYGPIPLIRQNFPISTGVKEVQVYREPVDDCVNYIVQLLDEASVNLPDRIVNEETELGRVSKAIALSLKAEVLITAASPLFNGNTDYSGLHNSNGQQLFNQTADKSKWERAAVACKEAIDFAQTQGYMLYQYSSTQYQLSADRLVEMSVRNAVNEPWNTEEIWGDINSRANDLQTRSTPRGLDPLRVSNNSTTGNIGVPFKIAEMFYTKNGVPISEDKTWDYNNRFKLKVGDADHKGVIKQGYTTVQFNFDREMRFYASLGFDGGIWYGMGKEDEKADLLFLSAKRGDPASMINPGQYSISGYWPKKLVSFKNIIESSSYTKKLYPWPVIRLGSLYLYYAEALNELGNDDAKVFEYVDLIRKRAGLLGVKQSWDTFTNNTKYATQSGMREIIKKERLIEMALEGQRFWDLRRWKDALNEFNKPIDGWDSYQNDPALYYRLTKIYDQKFKLRDYFWPINESELLKNRNLLQNAGW